jgi:hypothetical protein
LRVLVILAAILVWRTPNGLTRRREDAKGGGSGGHRARVDFVSVMDVMGAKRSSVGVEPGQDPRGFLYIREPNPRLTPWTTLCRPSGPGAMAWARGAWVGFVVLEGFMPRWWPQPRCGWFARRDQTQGCPRSSANPGLGGLNAVGVGGASARWRGAFALHRGDPHAPACHNALTPSRLRVFA